MSTGDSRTSLLKLLSQVTHAYEQQLNKHLRVTLRADLRPAHYAVFRYLDPAGSRISALAQEAGMTQQSMGELVAHMQRCGYVEREVDPQDRRARLVVLTEAGRAALEAAAERIAGIEETLVASLGPDELAALRESLIRVRHALR